MVNCWAKGNSISAKKPEPTDKLVKKNNAAALVSSPDYTPRQTILVTSQNILRQVYMNCILPEVRFHGPSHAAFIILIRQLVLEKIGKVLKSKFSVIGVKGTRAD